MDIIDETKAQTKRTTKSCVIPEKRETKAAIKDTQNMPLIRLYLLYATLFTLLSL